MAEIADERFGALRHVVESAVSGPNDELTKQGHALFSSLLIVSGCCTARAGVGAGMGAAYYAAHAPRLKNRVGPLTLEEYARRLLREFEGHDQE